MQDLMEKSLFSGHLNSLSAVSHSETVAKSVENNT